MQLKLDQMSREKDSLAKESARLKTEKGSLEKKLGGDSVRPHEGASLSKASRRRPRSSTRTDATKTELSSVRKELNARAALSQDEVAKEREERRLEAEQLPRSGGGEGGGSVCSVREVWRVEGKLAEADDSIARAACDAALRAVQTEAELRAVRDDHSESLEASKAEADKRLADANEEHRKREGGALQTHMSTIASLEDERRAVEAECATVRKERDTVQSDLSKAKDEISRLGDGLAKANVQNRSLEASLAALEERAMSDSQKSRKSIGEARKELHETTAKLHIEEEKTERLTKDKARLENEVQSAIEETEAARRHHIGEVKALHEKHTVAST